MCDEAPASVIRVGNNRWIGDTTMDFIVREPARAKRYTKAGFDAFWNAVAG